MKILDVEHVYKIFSQGTIALDDVSFSIEKGDFTLIAGSNGSGKSVLMSLIAGLDNATKGKITLFCNNVGLVFQEADAQILGETPYEDVAFGAKNCGLKKTALDECVLSALEKVNLLQKKDANARLLSGGEKRRLAVAGIIAMNRDFLIFDEPFSNLDWPSVRQVCNMMKDLKNEGKTIIVLTHETEKIIGLANRFIILDKGKIQFDGGVKTGLALDIEKWGIRNPLKTFNETKGNIEELVWL